MEFSVTAHTDFLVVMSRKIHENCYVSAWNQSENILVSISIIIIIMKKIAEKILFPAFTNKTLFEFLCQEPRRGKVTELQQSENWW